MAEILDGNTLSVERLCQIAEGARGALCVDARSRMSTSAEWVRTTIGAASLRLKWVWLVGRSPPERDEDLVRSFILGHCGGVGEPLPKELVRALIAARVNVLATGATGCRPECAETLLAMLDADVIPVIPSQGAVGAAGSPALAHLVAVACGFAGEAWRDGQRQSAAVAMEGLPLLYPTPMEALALLNGDSLTTALAAVAVQRAARLLDIAEAACAMSFEVCRADLDCLSAAAMQARRHDGAAAVAARLREALTGSEMCAHGRQADPFSIRCAPIVLGAAQEALSYVRAIVERELNAAASNPLIFPGEPPVEAGNFHGAPVALAMDHLKVALTQVASMSERRIFRMTYGQLSGLPSFLVPETGLNSGLMLAQYTAASLVSECKGLAHPASTDSIPTIQHREDHLPMGPIAARGALRIADMLGDVLAIELLCAAQGLDFRLAGESVDEGGRLISVAPLKAGSGTHRTWEAVRRLVPRWQDDRVLHTDLGAIQEAVRGMTDALAGLVPRLAPSMTRACPTP